MAISGSLMKGIQVRPLVVFVAGTCIASPNLDRFCCLATAMIASGTKLFYRHLHMNSQTKRSIRSTAQ